MTDTYDAKANGEGCYVDAMAAKRAELLQSRCPAAKRVVVIGNCELYQGDCLDVMKFLEPVDAVVTDPPYGVNLGNHGAKNETRPQFLAKKGYASYDDTPENFLAIVSPAIQTALTMADRGLVFSAGSMLWDLPKADALGGVYLPAACGRNAWGFASMAHCAFYGIAPSLNLGAKHTAIRSTKSAEKNGHPCPKPIEWMLWAVSLASTTTQTIMDPFMGSGTTGVACVKLGRRFVGVELDPGYFDIACERIRKAYDQPDMFIEQPAPKPAQEGFEYD